MLKAEYIVYLCVYINISCIFSVFLFLIIYLLVSYSKLFLFSIFRSTGFEASSIEHDESCQR